MSHSLRRMVAGFGIPALMVLTAAAWTAPAQAAGVSSGTFTFSGDAGDWISQGESYAYTAGANGTTINSSGSANGVSFSIGGWSEIPHSQQIYPDSPDWWSLALVPASGQSLAVGTYLNATRAPFHAPSEPGLEVDGNGRGCNTLIGSFTIYQISFAGDGSLSSINATFEQHCEGGVPAARGRIVVGIPDAPARGTITGATMSSTAKLSTHYFTRILSTNGTVTCTGSYATITGSLSQQANGSLTKVNFRTTTPCANGLAAMWSAAASSTKWVTGTATATAVVSTYDPYYMITIPWGSSLNKTLTVIPYVMIYARR